MLSADFAVQFGDVFAGQADNQVSVNLTSAPASGGTLNAWIDFDGDGQYHSAGEKIFSDHPLQPGNNILQFEVPFSTAAGNHNTRLTVNTDDPDQQTLDTSVGTLVWLSEPVIGARGLLQDTLGPSDILSADFDRDGDIDVMAANITGSQVSRY